jgi:hypothetical protein
METTRGTVVKAHYFDRSGQSWSRTRPLILFSVSRVILHCYFFAPKFKFEFQKGYHFKTNSYKTLVSITSYLLLPECT